MSGMKSMSDKVIYKEKFEFRIHVYFSIISFEVLCIFMIRMEIRRPNLNLNLVYAKI